MIRLESYLEQAECNKIRIILKSIQYRDVLIELQALQLRTFVGLQSNSINVRKRKI